jgi:hypothetical protein
MTIPYHLFDQATRFLREVVPFGSVFLHILLSIELGLVDVHAHRCLHGVVADHCFSLVRGLAQLLVWRYILVKG